jgi:arylsulfatase A-like enzyme
MRILYIDIDTLRPDHLSCYGYHRRTSPAIDALAARGVRFTGCHSSDAPCLPSRAALYSGRFGIQTGVVGHGGSAADPKIQGPLRGFVDHFGEQGLAHQLQNLGLHTAMISPFGQRHSAHWFYAGFHEVHNTGRGGMESAEHIAPAADRWLADHAAGDNWYLHVNFWDPHTPYRAPENFGNPFGADPLPAWLDDDQLIRAHMQCTGPHTALDLGMYTDCEDPQYPRHPGKITDRASMRRLIDGYDTGIRYTDDHVARIIAALQRAGVYDDTAIILGSDHGENFGELGIYAEHATADAATCRVPLIIKWPGGSRGSVDQGLHYGLDLAPTLMDLLGSKPCPIWDGQSFAQTIAPAPGSGPAPGRSELILSQACHVCQRSVRFDHDAAAWLYIRTYHDGFHLFPQEMLFNLSADPHEQHDLAAANPALCREAAWRLLRWHDAQMARMSQDKVDPIWTVIAEGGPFHARHLPGHSPLPEYLARLETTGRAVGAAALRAKYAAFLP